jgi:hypothetical protein
MTVLKCRKKCRPERRDSTSANEAGPCAQPFSTYDLEAAAFRRRAISVAAWARKARRAARPKPEKSNPRAGCPSFGVGGRHSLPFRPR